MSNNVSKNATLGMPHGTATHRLRKIILFHLLCRLEENVCFKCGKEIVKIEELSIEHIKPWEGVSADLFWDISNIAFSHLKCNRPDRLFTRGSLKPCPPGMNWCSPGQHFAATENFYKNESRWNGLQKWCKDHRPER